MAQLRDLLINGQSRFLGPAMFNDVVKFDNLIYLTSDARAEGDFIPSASVTYNLGTSSLKWKNVYAQIFYGALSGTVTGSLVGNADTATTLKTARNINGTAFNGSADIVTSLWGTARTISISNTAGTTGTSVNGSADVTLILPTTITGFTKLKATTFEGALSGNATSATKATKDGDGNVITATYAVKNHASTTTDYGVGNGSNYGHLKLSNATNSTSGVDGGFAATPAAVKAAYDLAASKISAATSSIELNSSGILANYGGFIDFHYHNNEKKPTNASGTVVETTPDYTSRIIEDAAGQININSVKFKNGIVTGAFSGTLTGALSGNATTATTLKTARSINGTSFDGSKDITTAKWGTARTISIGATAGTTGTAVDGSENETLILPTTITGFTKLKATTFEGALNGNATSATKATKDSDDNTITTTYLKLAGGTMSGDITFPSNKGIIQNQNSSSNYTTAITWLQGGVSEGKYNPSIGHHNTGDTDGAIILLPYSIPTAAEGETQINPWGGTVGLYISKSRLRWNGKDILHTGATVTTAQGGTGITSHTANRLVWSTSATQLQATNNHYVDANRLGVNYTSKSDYNLYVNGSSYLSAAVSIGGSLTVASTLTANTIARISQGLAIAQTTGAGAGISLYSSITANTAPTYGLMFAKTSNFSTHGAVTGDWATYFTMNDGAGRGWIFRKGTVNTASINNDGVATFTGIGNGTTYIQHPPGGEHTGASTETGFLTITLPVKFTSTMLKFKVSIYSYEEGTSVDYIIGGYNYSSDNTWYHPTAVCIGKKGAKHSNHPVTFGKNADGYAQIQIGSTGTKWTYPNINITDITLGHSKVYADWQKPWTISFTTTQQSTSKTVTNPYVGYNALNSDYATKADYLQVSSISTRDTGFYYYKGQPTIGTATGNATAGSNGTLGLWSYPENSGTAINTSNNTVNVQIMRMMWSNSYWSELFFSPNNQDIWTRSVQNGAAKAWRKIIDTGNLPNYIAGTANKIAKFTGTNSVGDSNISDDGSIITLGKSTTIKASSSSYREGLRVLPASDNGWALTFYSNLANSTSGTHAGGWLVGKRGAAGTYGAIGDFTIEENGSNGLGLTLHKSGGGATLYGSFKVIGKVSAASTGNSWISGKTITNASYSVSTKQSSDKYHPAFAITSNSGNVWNIGGLGDSIGIYGYYAARTANGTDFSTVWNTSTGALTHSGNFTTNGTLTAGGDTSLAATVKITHNESVTSGTTAGLRNTLCLYGQTYGNDSAYIKVAKQLSYGDPGPQIIFGTNATLANSQKIALIYTDHDTIATGNSLSLVSTETNASFIAPTIKALKGLIGTLTGNVVGNASTATTLQTARSFTIGDTAKTFDGSANVSWSSSEIGYKHVWTAVVTGQTWSRLCLVKCGHSVEGGAYILNISATRANVVYNDTFLIKAHHSKNGKIVKLSGHNYSNNYQVRLLVNSNGDSYFELYDNCNGITTSTTQNVHCNLIPIHTGTITKYTTFTSGATVPSDYSVKQTMIVTNEDIQANIRGDLTGNASTASYANNADTVDGKHASDFSTSTHKHTVSHTPAGSVSQPTFTGSAVMTSTGANSQKTMYSITSVGSAPSLTASVSSKCLTLTFSAGSVPTRESATVSLGTHTHSVTAAGTVSQPTFTGSAATLTTSTPV